MLRHMLRSLPVRTVHFTHKSDDALFADLRRRALYVRGGSGNKLQTILVSVRLMCIVKVTWQPAAQHKDNAESIAPGAGFPMPVAAANSEDCSVCLSHV